MEAFTAIEDTLQKEEKIDKLQEETVELRRSFDVLTSSYEENNPGDVRSYFVFSFNKKNGVEIIWVKHCMKG